jgi:hypothetical protein
MMVQLDVEEAAVLDREVTRLRSTLGINVTRSDIIRALIQQHRSKLQMVAKEDHRSTIAWLWGRTWRDDLRNV